MKIEDLKINGKNIVGGFSAVFTSDNQDILGKHNVNCRAKCKAGDKGKKKKSKKRRVLEFSNTNCSAGSNCSSSDTLSTRN